jgi:hypothetical protein
VHVHETSETASHTVNSIRPPSDDGYGWGGGSGETTEVGIEWCDRWTRTPTNREAASNLVLIVHCELAQHESPKRSGQLDYRDEGMRVMCFSESRVAGLRIVEPGRHTR